MFVGYSIIFFMDAFNLVGPAIVFMIIHNY